MTVSVQCASGALIIESASWVTNTALEKSRQLCLFMMTTSDTKCSTFWNFIPENIAKYLVKK